MWPEKVEPGERGVGEVAEVRSCEALKASVRTLIVVLRVMGNQWRVLSSRTILLDYYFCIILDVVCGIDGVWETARVEGRRKLTLLQVRENSSHLTALHLGPQLFLP